MLVLASRQFEVALCGAGSRKAATGGGAQPKRRRRRKKEKDSAKDGGSSSTGGEGVGRRVMRGSGLDPPARVQAAPTTPKQGSPADATSPQRLSMLTHPPPRVAAMLDEAEMETEEEHCCRLRIHEASAPPSSRCAFKYTSFSSRGRC